MDKVSSWGYAMGYIGGSTIPFVISIAMLIVFGYSNVFAQKFSIIITSVWWLVFSIPFIRNVEQTHYIERSGAHTLSETFRNIGRTAKDIFTRRGLWLFMIAYFFYIDGVGTIISISTAYGTVLGLGTVGMILALLVTQIVAVPCSILFSRLSEKFSARRMLSAAIIVYTLICVVGFYMGFSLEPHQEAYDDAVEEEYVPSVALYAPDALEGSGTDEYAKAYDQYVAAAKKAFLANDAAAQIDALNLTTDATDEVTLALIGQFNEPLREITASFYKNTYDEIDAYRAAIRFSTILFWCMACLVGTVQGGIQAVSRSYFGKLVPKERSNEFFGFFDIFGKFATVIGPVLYSLVAGWTGRSSYGVLCLILLFMVGLGVMTFGRKDLDALTEKRTAE